MTRFRPLLLIVSTLVTGAAIDSLSLSSAVKAQTPPAVSVRSTEVESGPLQTWLFAQGTARAVEREFLGFQNAGRIAYLNPELKEGDPVSEGQVIAYQQQDRPRAELAKARAGVVEAESQKTSAQASLEEAEASLRMARNTYRRFQNLVEQQSASQQKLDNARTRVAQARAAKVRAEGELANATHQIDVAKAQVEVARIVADDSRIVSPIDGVVARLNIEQGFYFSPRQIQANSETAALNTVPVVIIDPSAFETTVQLPSYLYPQVKVGATVLLQPRIGHQRSRRNGSPTTDTLPRAPEAFAIRGKVYSVSPSMDPQTRSFSVKLRSSEGTDRLRDGAFLTAWIAGPRAQDTPLIPTGTARFDDNQAYVFRVDPATNEVSRVNVTLGLQGRRHQQVVEGLAIGDQIVVKGQERLSNGDTVRVITDVDEGAVNP